MSNSDIDDSIRDNLKEGIRREVVPDLVDMLVDVIDNYHGIDARMGTTVGRLREIRLEEENKIRDSIRVELAAKEFEVRDQLLQELRSQLKEELIPEVKQEIKEELLRKLFGESNENSQALSQQQTTAFVLVPDIRSNNEKTERSDEANPRPSGTSGMSPC